jgi:hypothetical protein
MSRWQSVGHYFAQGRASRSSAPALGSYLPLLVRLSGMQSIWQFLSSVLPPLCHGMSASGGRASVKSQAILWIPLSCAGVSRQA